MGKGGSSVDTGGMQQAANTQLQYGDLIRQMAETNYNQGQQMYTAYEKPVLNMFKKLINEPATFTDPTMNLLMQLPLQQGSQAADAAKKKLLTSGLGPGAMATGMQQIDLSKMANAQTGALQQVQSMIQSLIGAGQQGTALQAGAPGQMGGAVSAVGQAGGLQAQIANLQASAAAQKSQGLFQGLTGIGQIAGLFGGMGPFGQLGAFGGGFGGGGGGSGGGGGQSTFDIMSQAPGFLASVGMF